MGCAVSPFGTVNGRYVLEEIIGSGGMGVVYLGRDTVLDRAVAVKMIREELAGEEFVRRFEREAAILARLRSPHIVVVYDYGRYENKFFLVTDYLPDGDLDQWISQHGQMPPEDAVRLVAQLAEGLADAHAHGVIHRDVKPANTLLWRRGAELRPVLADFGIAVAADLSLTAPGAIIGSPLYMAPERHLGAPATGASDIYSMGCLLFTLVTGSPPYWGTEFQAANAHLNEPVPSLPPDLPHAAALDQVIGTCMAKRPEDRFPSADALATRLAELGRSFEADRKAAGRSGAATTVLTAPPETTPPPPKRGRRRVVGMAAVLALVAGALAWWLVPDREPDDEAPTSGGQPTAVAEAPPTPGGIDARTVEDHLGVRVRVDLPKTSAGVQYVVERKLGGWRPTEPVFMLPTQQGGERSCARLRLVAMGDGGRTEGPDREVCGRAKPRQILMKPLRHEPCVERGDLCTYFDIVLRGFRPHQVLTVTWAPEGAPPVQTQVSIDDSGVGIIGANTDPSGVSHPGGLFVSDRLTSGTVRVDGVARTFDLEKLRGR